MEDMHPITSLKGLPFSLWARVFVLTLIIERMFGRTWLDYVSSRRACRPIWATALVILWCVVHYLAVGCLGCWRYQTSRLHPSNHPMW